MRTILLTRPTEPQQLPNICREQIPLSENGVALANTLFESAIFREADIVYASPCRHAYDPAVLQGKAVQTENDSSSVPRYNTVILDGKIRTPSVFVLRFENNSLSQISYQEQKTI